MSANALDGLLNNKDKGASCVKVIHTFDTPLRDLQERTD